MRLTSFTDFALRALMRLAGDPDRSFSTNDIAAEFGISRNHLIKVVRDLANGGFVITQRGAGGGFLRHVADAGGGVAAVHHGAAAGRRLPDEDPREGGGSRGGRRADGPEPREPDALEVAEVDGVVDVIHGVLITPTDGQAAGQDMLADVFEAVEDRRAFVNRRGVRRV